MTATRLLLFDIDGTLLLCRGRGVRGMQAAVHRVFGLSPIEVDLQPHGRTDPTLFEALAAAHGLARDAFADRLPELHAVYASELEILLREAGSCEVKPGVHALLAELATRPAVALGLVTGNLESTARLKLEAVALARHFETGAFGSDARHRADLVALALERFGVRLGHRVESRDTWVIGDTPDDVASGRAHGTRTLGVATGRHARHELESAGADVVLDDLTNTQRVVDILCEES